MLHLQVAGDPHFGNSIQATLPHYEICLCFPRSYILDSHSTDEKQTSIYMGASQLPATLDFRPEDLFPFVAPVYFLGCLWPLAHLPVTSLALPGCSDSRNVCESF